LKSICYGDSEPSHQQITLAWLHYPRLPTPNQPYEIKADLQLPSNPPSLPPYPRSCLLLLPFSLQTLCFSRLAFWTYHHLLFISSTSPSTPTITLCTPIRLASSKNSTTSSSVAPNLTAFRICNFKPYTYKCVIAQSIAMFTNSLTLGDRPIPVSLALPAGSSPWSSPSLPRCRNGTAENCVYASKKSRPGSST
jgi:hypothetical protein